MSMCPCVVCVPGGGLALTRVPCRFNETGSNCPSVLTSQQQLELLELSEKSLKACGMRLGVFHVEAKYTSRGPRLIEINSRMGGGPVRLTNLLVWGVDLVEVGPRGTLLDRWGLLVLWFLPPQCGRFSAQSRRTGGSSCLFSRLRPGGAIHPSPLPFCSPPPPRQEHMMASIGIPVRPPAARAPLKFIAEYSINAPRSGVIENDRFLAKWVGHPNVIYARPLVSPGDKVVGAQDGLPTWLGEVMVQMPSGVHDAIEFVRSITDSTDLPILDA